MASPDLSTAASALSNPTQSPSKRLRLIEVGLVVGVAISHPLLGVAYYLHHEIAEPSAYSLLSALLHELSAITLLWYVLFRQGRRWGSICGRLRWYDPLLALGLVFAASCLAALNHEVFQMFYYSVAHHHLAAKSLSKMLGLHLSVAAILFVCINPFFEELIVRAYLTSEVIGMTGSKVMAVMISTAVQLSYHLYQGTVNVIAISAYFFIFSIYYARTNRITPVILAHLYLDVGALLAAAS